MSLSAETLTLSKKYTKQFLTLGSEYKGMISNENSIPTAADVGDWYICNFNGTVNGIGNITEGKIILRNATGWDLSTFIIKGNTGLKGDKGDAFEYSDFTTEQLEYLKGKDGVTPIKGVDYFTDEDKSEMIEQLETILLGGEY